MDEESTGYSCDLCDAVFTTQRGVTAHKTHKHKSAKKKSNRSSYDRDYNYHDDDDDYCPPMPAKRRSTIKKEPGVTEN